MAEPVGITGTAAGLVSLGLQLYSEISSYLAAYKGRQKDLDFARHQCATLKRCIDAIDAAITSPGFRPTVSRDALDASVQDCQRELDALNELVVGLQGPSLPATTVPAKLRETECETDCVRDVLLVTYDKLGEIKSVVDVVCVTAEDTRTGINYLSRNFDSIRTLTSRAEQILPVIEERTATAASLMAQQTETVSQVGNQLSTRIDDSTRIILDKFEEVLADMGKQTVPQPNVADIKRSQLSGAATPENMQAMPNRLLTFASTTKRVSQHGSVLEKDTSALMHRAGNETLLCNCIKYWTQKHRQARWGPVMLQTKWRANIRHLSKCKMGKFIKNQYQRSHRVELTIPALQSLTGKAIRVFWSLTSGTDGISLGRELSVINTFLYFGDMSTECGQQAVWLAHSLQLLQVPPNSSHDAGRQKVSATFMRSQLYSLNDRVVLDFPGLQIDILRQDVERISQILNNNPSSVSDINCFGHNSVHIAVIVGNLKVLQMIMLHADTLALNAQNYTTFTDNYYAGRFPIEYAVEPQLHSTCHVVAETECNGCQILDALLQAECALYETFFVAAFSKWLVKKNHGTSECAMKKIIVRLKERRQRLQEYARKYLAPTRATELGLYGSDLLDAASEQVQTALQERSILVPISLRVYDAENEIVENRSSRSIHCYFSDDTPASYAWKLGFRDLGVDSAYGFHELLSTILFGTEHDQWQRNKVISHAYWLIEKGVEVGKLVPCLFPGQSNFTGWTAAHLWSYYLCQYPAISYEEKEYYLRVCDEFAHATMSTAILDDCQCACSYNGCSPLMIMLRARTRRDYWGEAPSQTLEDYKHDILWFCHFWAKVFESRPWSDSSQPKLLLSTILRYFTFTALDIRHTCCQLGLGLRAVLQQWGDAEIKEVMEEQEENICLLEDLLEDFEQEYISIPDLEEFFYDYWGPKMEMEIEKLNARKLDEDDLRAAEEVGVVWKCFETEEATAAEKDYSRLPGFERWMKRLNDIAPEPDLDIPLPPDIPVQYS
ncbi:hypothetical protein CKAH01_16677 [Colletotrichum kahawae]|uniref:Fungal N-terminal domain-containing protein n=1 Tax=Colletotrichum kahawae TaxID=34407 RepID=A0AAD9YFQ1_COLKA|nr:hypothetical protein CKAH01_16677 [Colletotrichum kahawae]